MVSTREQLVELDNEWVALILNAKRAGVTIEEVREFLFTNNKGYDAQEMESHTP